MDSNALKAFVTVAEQQSFSTAAERLFLTQPAISKRIANLEQQLGCRLFDRIGRKISLTEAGRQLLPRAQTILLELEDTRRLLANREGRIEGQLSLATSHHIGLHRLPPLLRRFHRNFPQVTLDLRFEESEVAYDAVLNGELELAIITLSPDPDPLLHSRELWHDPLCFCCAPDHPLAAKAPLTLTDLTEHIAILPTRTTFTRQLVEQRFEQQQLQLNVGTSTNQLDTLRMMVSVGLGWSLLPHSLAHTATADSTALTVLRVETAAIERSLGVIYHRNRTLSNAAQTFIDLLLEHSSAS